MFPALTKDRPPRCREGLSAPLGSRFPKAPLPMAPLPKALLPLALLLLAVLLLTLVGGCAKTSDLRKEQEANLIQERRIKALEQDTEATISGQSKRLVKLEREVKSLRGKLLLVTENNVAITREQSAIRETQERVMSSQHRMTRTVTEESAKMARFRLESENDLDKIRTRLGEIENLQRSSIANLPSKTRADKMFREANLLIVNGELDLAADRFAGFVKKFPKDGRSVEATFRRGQALFLLRKYDHALIPFFQVVEKTPTHKLSLPARWLLARSLEETGDLRLARDFYAQLITGKTPYGPDATKRVAFLNKLFPKSVKKSPKKKRVKKK